MTGLPVHIEEYLLEAGFSGTELLVLKYLFGGESFSLRELASRSGKSTGVLDQATKKLILKGIVKKESINNSPKLLLSTFEAIGEWVQKDMQNKKDALQRKQNDFNSFISSLKITNARPDMEYFDGEEGIEKAYRKLLTLGDEILRYAPMVTKEEEDPLHIFRVHYFRERRQRKIFERVIGGDVPLGKRFQSRDIFEYRKTILVPEDKHPLLFEKIIVGNTVGCFNVEEGKACFIHFPQFAKAERVAFELLWSRAIKGRVGGDDFIPSIQPDSVTNVPMKTKAVSGLRTFFMSKKNLAALSLFSLIALLVTYSSYKYTWNVMQDEIGHRLMSIAINAEPQFETGDLNALQIEEDWRKPEWARVVNQLKHIKSNNENVVFAYIFRESDKGEAAMEFVADAESINPYANVDDDTTNDVDANGDGQIDPEGPDKLQWPGQEYPDPPTEGFEAMEKPAISEEVYSDAWGSMLSGYAPIKNESGDTIAVLAVDMSVGDIERLTRNKFKPVVIFLIVLFLLILNKFIWEIIQQQKIII